MTDRNYPMGSRELYDEINNEFPTSVQGRSKDLFIKIDPLTTPIKKRVVKKERKKREKKEKKVVKTIENTDFKNWLSSKHPYLYKKWFEVLPDGKI